MDNPDDDTEHDLPFTSSGVVDVNTIVEVPDATTLNRLAQLKGDITANVVTGFKIQGVSRGWQNHSELQKLSIVL